MKNIEFDKKSQFRIGKDKIIERNHFYSMTDLCMESGIYFKDKWSSPDGKWELRISDTLCLDTEQHQQVYRELWVDALIGKKEIFSRQIGPRQPKSIHEDGRLSVLILQYNSD